jgi:hypothetical protein
MDPPQSYINKYGGKAGGWFYLRDVGGFEGNLLPLHYIPPGVDVDDIGDLLPDNIQNNWILRGTHPNDHEGFVDILLSCEIIGFREKRKTVMDGIRNSTRRIRESAASPEVYDYSRYEGQAYDGKVGVGIQPLNPGRRGSVVEHPHQRDTYLIDLVTHELGKPTDFLDRITVIGNDVDKRSSIVGFYRTMEEYNEELARQIADLYRRVRSSGFIPSSYSLQMEFGVNENFFEDRDRVLFYQARPFREFIDPPYEMKGDESRKYRCFGVTPEEGVILPVVRTFHQEGIGNIPHNFAWVVSNITGPMNASARPRNMKAFLPIGLRVYSLEHNTYRWVRKADVSILDPEEEFVLKKFKTGDKINIKSNGLSHILEKAA